MLLVSLAVSYSIELVQTFPPTRFPSGVDVVAKTLGSLLGLVLLNVRQRGTWGGNIRVC